MKVTFLLPDLRIGGAQKMIVNMANMFAVKGHDVDLVIIVSAGSLGSMVSDQVNVIRLSQKRVLFGLFPFARYIKTKRPDICLSALYHVNVLGLLSQLLVRRVSTRFIVTERNLFSLRSQNSDRFLDKYVFRYLIRFLYRRADKIVAISQGVADDLALVTQINRSAIQCIYNPVVTKDFKDKINAHIELPWDKDDDAFIYVASGRLVKQKDYPNLLIAFSQLLKSKPRSKLIILGDGADAEALKAFSDDLRIGEHICFYGFVENPLAIMAQADAFVISSLWEGFGNVIVEALYCGLPVVSTDCRSGPSEILCDGKYGTLVAVSNDKALCDAMIEMQNMNVDAKKQRKRAMDFSVEKICGEYESLIDSLIKSGNFAL